MSVQAQQSGGPPAGYYKGMMSGFGFEIVDRGAYSFADESGNYRYEPSTSQIFWVKGPFNEYPPATYRVNDQGIPTIILVIPPIKDKQTGQPLWPFRPTSRPFFLQR